MSSSDHETDVNFACIDRLIIVVGYWNRKHQKLVYESFSAIMSLLLINNNNNNNRVLGQEASDVCLGTFFGHYDINTDWISRTLVKCLIRVP